MREYLVLATLALAAVMVPTAARSAPIIGWELDRSDMAYLRQATDRAPEFGVNLLMFCYVIPKHGSQLPDTPEMQRDLNELVDRAHQHGIKAMVWEHQIDTPPKELVVDGKLDFDNKALWTWLDQKQRRLFELVPKLDGIALTMRETTYPPHQDGVKSALTPTQRVTKLINAIATVCEEKGKTLWVRDFSVEPGELQILMDGINASRPGVCAMTKHVARDWHPFLPPSPALGKYPGRQQIVEFDLCGEYFGQSLVPYCVVGEIKDRWTLAQGKGAAGAVGRVDRTDNSALGSLNEVNLYAFNRLVKDSSTPADVIIRDYAREHYGEAAAQRVADALARSYDILNKTLLIERMKFLNEHSALPDLDYAVKHIGSASLAIWLPEYKPLEDELYHPTEKTVQEVVAEKDEAVALARRSLADIEAAKADLKPEDYEYLHDQFERLLAIARLWRPMSAAFMHYLMLREHPSDEARQALAVELAEAETVGGEIQARWGDGFTFGSETKGRADLVPRLKQFVGEIRTRAGLAD
jgi:hypothetical protein